MSSIKDCVIRLSKLLGVAGKTAPTDASVHIVSEQLGFILPGGCVEFAGLCPSYAFWISSTGEEYADTSHILKK